jgi:NTE family protein
MSRPKVGLALGSGAARGMAHIGVLEVLEKEGIPIDFIAGTSSGAIIGGVYARTKNAKLLRPLAMAFGRRRMRYFTDFSIPHINAVRPLAKALRLHKIKYFSDLTLPWTGLIKGHHVEEELKRLIGRNTEFKDLLIPLTCVAVDIDKGEEVVISDGKVWEAARASSSIPVIFSPKVWRGRNLVDGLLLNPVPTQTARDMGADFVISVNVLPHKAADDHRESNIMSIMLKSFYMLDSTLVQNSLNGADVVIEPDVLKISFTDFHRAEECVAAGARATMLALPEIRQKLGLT